MVADTPPATAADLAALLRPLRDLCDVLREPRALPELLTRETFAALLDVGVSTFDRLRETGEIGPQPIKLAGLKWHREEAVAWLRHRAASGELHDAKTWPAVWASLRRRAEGRSN